MRILITGAGGFVGKHLREGAKDHGEVVSVQRRPTEQSDDSLIDYADLADPAQVKEIFERWRPDVVLHAAARIPRSPQEDINSFFDDNVRATVNVYYWAHLVGVRRVVFSSSMSVYGRPQSVPVNEAHPTEPETPYALSKIQSELVGRYYANSGLETTVLRYSGIFGAGQRSGAVPAFITRCLHDDPLSLTAGGRPSSDFVWVQDVVQSNLLAAEYKQNRNFEIFNIGSGVELTIGQLASTIRDLCRSGSSIGISQDTSPRDFRFAYDISRARELLAYVPTSMESALHQCICQKREGQW
jgi:UDP-glucose 4-epimerase